MNELALFAGAGGGILGGHLLGWRTVCAVEINAYCAQILMQRQNDGCLPPFPIWDDVRTFDGCPWRGAVDVISGGFPCQDISAAGKGAGIDGERSGLWKEFARIIGEVGPCHVLVENSPMLTSSGLGRVLGDLSALGFHARWGVFSACSIGLSHTRERLFLVANSNEIHGEARMGTWKLHPSNHRTSEVFGIDQGAHAEGYFTIRMEDESKSNGMVDAMAGRVDRLEAIGNGQVPAVVRLAWETLK